MFTIKRRLIFGLPIPYGSSPPTLLYKAPSTIFLNKVVVNQIMLMFGRNILFYIIFFEFK
jgi:hypothetical protein